MMNETLLGAVLLLLLGLGILVVVTDRLFTAVVYSAALSACIAFGYLLLGAPDVALAEAIIGSALTTVIYLATLKKYRIFTIRCLPGDTRKDPLFSKVLEVISRSLKDHDLEAHLIESRGNARTLLDGRIRILSQRRGRTAFICMERRTASTWDVYGNSS